MKRIVYLTSLLAFVLCVLSSASIAGPSHTVQDDQNSHELTKIYVKIEAPETISEAVENQIIGQLQKIKNVSLVDDPDDADHIFRFDIHEIRTRSDLLTGYAIVLIWTWRKGVRELEETFGNEWDQADHDKFTQVMSGMSFYLLDEFYTCAIDGLKQRLTSIVAKIDTKVVNRIPKR
jgi:hypothetical protein